MYFLRNPHEIKGTRQQDTAKWQNRAESVPNYTFPSSHPLSSDSMLTAQKQCPEVKKETILQ